MDQYFKKLKPFQLLIFIYFFIFSVFLFNFLPVLPKAVKISKKINGFLKPHQIYPAKVYFEKKIDFLSKPTSIYRSNYKRDGIYKNIMPDRFKISFKTFKYNGALHGASKSSPAVDSSGIYVGSDDAWFYAFNHDGSVRWKYYTSRSYQGIHSTALLTKKYVFFGSYNGYFYSLDKQTGKLHYSLKLADAVGAAPLLYKGYIYLSVETNFLNAYVLKIHAKTGKVIWRTQWLGEQIHSSVSLNPKQGLLYVGTNGGFLFAIEMRTGELFWSYDAKKPIKSTPLVHKNRVYFSSWNKSLTVLNAKTGKFIFKIPLKDKSQSSPTLIPHSNILIIGSHNKDPHIYGIDIKKRKILWQKRFDHRANTHSGFSARNKDHKWLYYGACKEKLFCVLDPKTGNILESIKIPRLLTGVPLAYKKAIYLSLDQGGLIKLEALK